jgi:hypothetical protein
MSETVESHCNSRKAIKPLEKKQGSNKKKPILSVPDKLSYSFHYKTLTTDSFISFRRKNENSGIIIYFSSFIPSP